MSETTPSPEIHAVLSPSDGREIVSQVTQTHKKGFTRRQFLKLSATVAAGYFLAGYFLIRRDLLSSELPIEPTPEPSPTPTREAEKEPKPILEPELIHGIEIYGLKEKIQTQEQVDELYAHFDYQFEKKLPADFMKSKDRFEQRDFILDPNKRYLEVVVRQSVYDDFEKQKGKNGFDFIEWNKMHVDFINRAIENAKPPSSLQAELLRIVVVDDSFTTNPSKYSKDLDATWFEDEVYIADPAKEEPQPFFWPFFHDKNGNLVFRWPSNRNWADETEYAFPPKTDSLTGKNNVWLDIGLTHEWSHVLLNLPDEYVYDHDLGDESQFRFRRFYFGTGSFQEPWLSPNLAYILKYNQTKRIRGSYTDLGGLNTYSIMEKRNTEKPWVYSQRPDQVRITIKEKDKIVTGEKSIYRARQEGDYYSRKTFLDIPDQESEENTFKLNSKVFEVRYLNNFVFHPINWIIRVENDKTRELHLPAAAFNMSKIAGKNQVHYEINFTGYENPDEKTQILKLVDELYLKEFLEERRVKGDLLPYAFMKVDGTSCYFVWLSV